MRPLPQCRIAKQSITIRECMVSCSISGRRSGAVMLTDDAGVLKLETIALPIYPELTMDQKQQHYRKYYAKDMK